MSTEAFNTMRKNLVESVTGSALDWLAYMGTDAALAAVPDTTPPRYVVAGTLADIVKLLLAAEAIHPPLTAPAPLTDELKRERDSFERMFLAACADLGLVNEALGLDPDDGGADPILEAIEELKTKAAAVQFDADELRKLILNVSNTSHWCGAIGGDADDYAVALAKANASDEALFSYVKNLAAPAPQQSEPIATEAQISAAGSALADRSADSCGVNREDNWMIYGSEFIEDARVAFAAAAKAAPAAPVQTAEPKRIPDMLTVETIQGAIAFGRMGINPPPSPDHWGNEFWQIGRQLAKLSETSAWDNVTPVDVAAPVQANLQSIADELEDAAAPYGGDFADTVNACVEALRDLVVPTSTEEMVRFCPHCASIGEIGKEYRDCCPDGSAARHIPRKVAEVCRDTFKLAIGSVAAPVQAEQAQAEPARMSQRASFEHWYSDEGQSPRAVERNGEGYKLMGAQAAWSAWKACYAALDVTGRPSTTPPHDLAPALPAHAEQTAAVRAAALEEAALAAEKVADDFCERQGGKWPDLRDDAETGARSCVDEIRALAAPSTATSNDTGALGGKGAES
jgi:hypothetical protein